MNNAITHVILRKRAVESDWKLHSANPSRNNGRKVFVNDLFASKETPVRDPEWQPAPPDGLTPVYVTGDGGLEIATFTEKAAQDRHQHLASTEIYTVLEGTMTIKINAVETTLACGDEIVVLPGTIHEIVPMGDAFLTRVHAINCHGIKDKYVEAGGEWKRATDNAATSTNQARR